MTETADTPPTSSQEPLDTAESPPAPAAEPAPEEKGSAVVRTATIVVAVVCLVLLVLYLIANRFTPYTRQARLTAIVVPIAPQVSGVVDQVFVSENQEVEVGQVLFNIDPTNYELAVQAAEADLQAADQAVGTAQANVIAAEAGVEASKASLAFAQLEADRLQRIQQEDPGAISVRRVQSALASLDVSRAQLAASEANLEKARQDLGQTGAENARILKAQSTLDKARVDLGRTSVPSPGVGLVTGVRVDSGNFAAAGAPLMTFVGIDNVWVQADFTENNLGHIEPGDRVDIVFDAHPGRIFKGAIRSLGYGVSVDSAPLGSLPTIENDRAWLRDAQRFPAVIDFDVSADSQRLLKVGSQASVVVYTGVHPIMNSLARLRIRLESLLTYAY